MVIGGDSGPLGGLSADHAGSDETSSTVPPRGGREDPRGLGLYLGKNDFWGFPDATTYHATFQHFSPGYLLLGLMDPGSNQRIDLPHFAASQRLADGRLSASASDPSNGFALSVTSTVLSSRNVVLSSLTTSCPPGVYSVRLNLTLGSDNPFLMPLKIQRPPEKGDPLFETMEDPLSPGGGGPHASGSELGHERPALTLAKSSVRGAGRYPPVMTPCSNQIVYNGIRTFSVDGITRRLVIHNGTMASPAGSPKRAESASPRPDSSRLCFHLEREGEEVEGVRRASHERGTGRSSGSRVVTGPCQEDSQSWWVLGEDGYIRMDLGQDPNIGALTRSAGWVSRGEEHHHFIRHADPEAWRAGRASGNPDDPLRALSSEDRLCLSVFERPPEPGDRASPSVTCQPRSYYTDPSLEGACQSMRWQVLPVPCAEATTWSHDRSSGFIASLAPGAEGRCLTSVGPVASDNLAMSVVITGEDGHRPGMQGDLDPDPDPSAAGSSMSVFLDSPCGASLTVAIGVVTQRDAVERYGLGASDEESLTRMATLLAGLGPHPKEDRHAKWIQMHVMHVDLDPDLGIHPDPDLDTVGGQQTLSSRDLFATRLAALMSEHATWWRRFYDRSWVDLGGGGGVGPLDEGAAAGEWADLERFYWSMLYLMGCSMREGAVAPAAWGPFSTSDTPQVGTAKGRGGGRGSLSIGI